MINTRILYFMFRRFNQQCAYLAAGIGALLLLAGYIYLSIAGSHWLFGNGIWGLIPIALLIMGAATYPFAAQDFKDELKMQDKVADSLKKDWINGFKN